MANIAPISIILASRNRKKRDEMEQLLASVWESPGRRTRVVIDTLESFPDSPEVEEDADTFAGNARKKAAETAQALGRWILADDSGLAVDALGGDPGVYSARYAGSHGDDAANNAKLLNALADVPFDRRGAAFHCALALADPTGAIRLEASGICRGRILLATRGEHGFGYDPLFLIPEYQKTFGELPAIVKLQISHRSRAFITLGRNLPRLIDRF